MPLEDKVKIIEKLEEGVSNIDVGRIFFPPSFFSVNESTMSTIKENQAITECFVRPLQGAVHFW